MSSEASQSVLDRVQMFMSERKQAILVGASVAVVIGGVAYYASASSSKGLGGSPGKARSKEKSKKRKGVKDADGPILEEVKVDTEEDRAERAKILKAQGNAAYSARKFQEAADMYTQAIRVTPKPESVYYSNRAACYMNFKQPDYEKAIADCTEALKIDSKYQRAISRRANALEKLGRLTEAVADWTALAMITKFDDESVSVGLDRTLKALTDVAAIEMYNKREPRLPPHSFVDAYFGAFRPRPRPTLPEEPSQGDKTFELALDALDASDYTHALSLINESIEQGISFPEGKSYALNLRGSFRFLWGDSAGASDDLKAAIKAYPSFTQNYVKIASVHMEQGKATEAFNAFEEAIKQDAGDPDIYYHRGQVMFIMGQFDQAEDNYEKSLKLDSTFVFSYIQLAVAQYKSGSVASAMLTFRRALKAFPHRSEPFNYYGELLLDQKRFDEAIEKFDSAIEIEKAKTPPISVLAMVNKALALFQSQANPADAERVLDEALQYDPDCEAAIATLAQIMLSSGKVVRAAELFRKQADLARTLPDIQNAMQFAFATDAQYTYMQNYPDDAVEIMKHGVRF